MQQNIGENTALVKPEIGEIGSGRKLGYKDTARYIWVACIDCGKERWARLYRGSPRALRCSACELIKRRNQLGKRNPRWKGGRVERTDGYIAIKIYPDDFFYPMARKDGYVSEHRLVMAQHLGRCLQPWEKVHHKDGIKNHNEYNNLKMTTAGSHSLEHSKGYRDGYRQGLQDGQSEAIRELKQEIRLLRWELKERKEVL